MSLAHAHTWIHPRDLALRDAGLTGSYAVAPLAGRLDAELPEPPSPGPPGRTCHERSITYCARRSSPHGGWRTVSV
jgi:hypothetical protein